MLSTNQYDYVTFNVLNHLTYHIEMIQMDIIQNKKRKKNQNYKIKFVKNAEKKNKINKQFMKKKKDIYILK